MRFAFKPKQVAIGSLLALGVICAVALVSTITYISLFSVASGLRIGTITNIIKTAYKNRATFKEKDITFLLLGLDKRNDSLEHTLLTDTILFASLTTNNGKLTTVSLPRDLWIPALQTKVNALYFYGQKDGNPLQYINRELQTITGISPSYYVVLNYNDLKALIDSLGGIEVTVERAFVDTEYPNPNYQEGSTEPIYTTVSFQQGKQWLDGEKALAFVRSRHSETVEGSDIARSSRQTIVFQSILSRIKSRAVVQNPTTLGRLYRFWDEKIETNLTDSEAGALVFSLRGKPITTASKQIPDLLLVHPPVSKYGLWVWEPRDPSWEELKEFMKENL